MPLFFCVLGGSKYSNVLYNVLIISGVFVESQLDVWA